MRNTHSHLNGNRGWHSSRNRTGWPDSTQLPGLGSEFKVEQEDPLERGDLQNADYAASIDSEQLQMIDATEGLVDWQRRVLSSWMEELNASSAQFQYRSGSLQSALGMERERFLQGLGKSPVVVTIQFDKRKCVVSIWNISDNECTILGTELERVPFGSKSVHTSYAGRGEVKVTMFNEHYHMRGDKVVLESTDVGASGNYPLYMFSMRKIRARRLAMTMTITVNGEDYEIHPLIFV